MFNNKDIKYLYQSIFRYAAYCRGEIIIEKLLVKITY
jgi:hypothetical protein